MHTTKQLLTQAKHEILHLRRRNEILSAQMAVVDVFARATAGVQAQGGCSSVDIAWSIDRHLEELDAADKQEGGTEHDA